MLYVNRERYSGVAVATICLYVNLTVDRIRYVVALYKAKVYIFLIETNILIIFVLYHVLG